MMKRVIAIGLAALLLGLSSVLADDQSREVSEEKTFDVHHWLTYYYEDPQPEKTYQAIRELYASGFLTDPTTQSKAIGFFAVLFRDNPEITKTVRDSCYQYVQAARWTIANALWFADTKTARSELKEMEESNKFLKPFLDNDCPDLLKSKEFHQSTLDMLWGFYYASGDPKYLERILKAFDSEVIAADATLKESIRSSLVENCLGQKRVRDYCQAKSGKLSERGEAEMKEILNDSE